MQYSTTRPIRWGIIGCGDVTEVKSGPAYQQCKGFELVAVMRRNGELARDYAQRHGVERFYDNADALINDAGVDAVYIATPPDSHTDYALRVAAAGKPCCIEKPMAPSYRECRAIVDAFSVPQLPLFVAYYRRSLPRFTKVKSLLASGAIGEPRHISWHLSKPPNEADRTGADNWRTDSRVAPGGYFDDLASHGLDLFAYLLGNYSEVHGIQRNQQKLYTAFDAITACWVHDNNVTGSGSWNFGSRVRKDQVTIEGSEGELAFSIIDEAPINLQNAEGQASFQIDHPTHIQAHHVAQMRDALLYNAPHPSTGASAAHTAWVVDQILGREL